MASEILRRLEHKLYAAYVEGRAELGKSGGLYTHEITLMTRAVANEVLTLVNEHLDGFSTDSRPEIAQLRAEINQA